MENTMMNSQSAAAKNSANVVFNSNCSKSGYLQMPISNVNYDDVITFVGNTIAEQKKDAYFEVKISNGISMDISFTKNYFSKKYEVSYRVFVNGELDYDACSSIELDFKVMSGVNINKAVGAVVNIIMEFIEDNKENMASALEEADSLEDAPILEDAPMLEEDDDITEEGYSVRGLEYLAETMPVVPVDAIVEGVNDYFSDCYAVARNRCMGFYECDFEEFCDIVWSYVWPNVMTEEALEAETRYYMEFNDRLRYMLDNGELGALYIYNNGFVRSRFDEEAEVAA